MSRADAYELPHKAPSVYRSSVYVSVNGTPDLKSTRVQKLTKHLFKPGMIIRALVHEQDFHGTVGGSTITVANKYTTESRLGLIHSQFRKLIVLALHEIHYLTIP